MGDKMRPVPCSELAKRIFNELAIEKSIFGISADSFYVSAPDKKGIKIVKHFCETPVGPAAGPHTQLAQNIISSYLTGGRFIELKTVQILDTLEIEKPCIDVRDEGYNVEWSTEYTLDKAYDEYLKAWLLLHVIESLLKKESSNPLVPQFMFNMSVGYDLKGIKTPKMQNFIDSMLNAELNPNFLNYKKQLIELLDDDLLEGTGFENYKDVAIKALQEASPVISPTVTLSTMHGCPPTEIEAICKYMLEEKQIDTFVKLNPTLLGFETVKEILHTTGYSYISLNKESFEHDLQFADAIAMLKRLLALSANKGKLFGIKLTNTLGAINNQHVLPGSEMYMSGRALYPLSVRLAALLSHEFQGELPISYSGGANAFTVKALFEAGIHPITVATDLLKPGGYYRLKEMAEICDKADGWDCVKTNTTELQKLAEEALQEHFLQKSFRGEKTITTGEKLPVMDCYIAPCTVACPIGQDIPEYIYLAGQGMYKEALEIIYDKNALPNITGYICDHQCMYNCTRMDYEGAVEIREVKRIAVENGFDDYIKEWDKPVETSLTAAIIGAGPAGLSAAYFMARSGFSVTVLEKELHAGGVVRNVIPGFRLPDSAIEADVDFIKKHGVNFRFGVSQEETAIDALKDEGFNYIIYAVGAEKDNNLKITGNTVPVIHALNFLRNFKKAPHSLSIGKKIVVVGGGNTAMDSARAASSMEGVEKVTVVYRRSFNEMPADFEEYENAIKDGVQFLFLTNPEMFTENKTLVCRKMTLGMPDETGRRRPVPTESTVEIEIDTLITAIGEQVDTENLITAGIPVDASGWALNNSSTFETPIKSVYIIGDAQSGPSTVVQCIASARKVVENILDIELGPESDSEDSGLEDGCDCCGDHTHSHSHECEHENCDCDDHDHEIVFDDTEDLTKAENEFFHEIQIKKGKIIPSAFFHKPAPDKEFANIEAARCLECSYICNKCVEVCPNRANIAIDVREVGIFNNPFQIVHIDAYCNECGNCATFCPWIGKPYKDKLTIFSRKDDFDSSDNEGFFLDQKTLYIRFQGEVLETVLKADDSFQVDISDEYAAVIQLIIDSYEYLLGPVNE